MQIQVTEQDINEGQRASTCRCPIALALLRAKPECRAEVGDMIVTLNGNQGQSYFLPLTAQTFIRKFDTKRPVKPFTFDLPI